jgi:hypothetical protein
VITGHQFNDRQSVLVRHHRSRSAQTLYPSLNRNFLTGIALHEPNATQIACQHPKPILLDTGEMTFPCPWTANVIPLQLVALGRELVIIGVSAEFTTMAGRRVR